MVLFFSPENETLWKLIATLNHWTPNNLAREHILFTGTLSHKCLLCFWNYFLPYQVWGVNNCFCHQWDLKNKTKLIWNLNQCVASKEEEKVDSYWTCLKWGWKINLWCWHQGCLTAVALHKLGGLSVCEIIFDHQESQGQLALLDTLSHSVLPITESLIYVIPDYMGLPFPSTTS